MNGITMWMEKYLVPVAAKIGSQKHLVALRDSFIGILPATLTGALAAMVSAIVTTFPQSIQQMVWVQPSLPNSRQKMFGLLRIHQSLVI